MDWKLISAPAWSQADFEHPPIPLNRSLWGMVPVALGGNNLSQETPNLHDPYEPFYHMIL